MEEKRTSLVSRKPGKTGVGQRNREKIREAYANANPNLEVIPVKETVQEAGEPRKLRVCGYCRVSTESDNQQGSFELQVRDQERVIRENPAFVRIDSREFPGGNLCGRRHICNIGRKTKRVFAYDRGL